MNCLTCSTPTKNPKFCSRSCAATYNNKLTPRRKPKKICVCSCGVTIGLQARVGRRTRCDKCTPSFINYSLKEALDCSDGHRSTLHSRIRNHARSQARLRVQECEECGYSKHVEICHVKPISSFPVTALVSEINHNDNLKILCPNHHWELDNLE